MSEEENEKTCFVIGPIGDEESPERERSDKILKHIIKPAVKEYGYKTVRSDKISKPGSITLKIIKHLINDPLVIADLTDENANVFYELGIRHAAQKPFIQIVNKEQSLPFDISDLDTIKFNTEVDSAEYCKQEIKKNIQYLEENPEGFYTPISWALLDKQLWDSEDEVKKSYARIISMLEDIRSLIDEGSRPKDISLSLTDKLSIEDKDNIKRYIKNVTQSEAFKDLMNKWQKYGGGPIPANGKPSGLEDLTEIQDENGS